MKRQSTSNQHIYIPLIRPLLLMTVILVLVQVSHVAHNMEMLLQLIVVLAIYTFFGMWMVWHYR